MTCLPQEMSPAITIASRERTLGSAPDAFPLLPHLPIILFSPQLEHQAGRPLAASCFGLGAGHPHVTCVLFSTEGWGGALEAAQQLLTADIVNALSTPWYPFPFLPFFLSFPLSSSPLRLSPHITSPPFLPLSLSYGNSFYINRAMPTGCGVHISGPKVYDFQWHHL